MAYTGLVFSFCPVIEMQKIKKLNLEITGNLASDYNFWRGSFMDEFGYEPDSDLLLDYLTVEVVPVQDKKVTAKEFATRFIVRNELELRDMFLLFEWYRSGGGVKEYTRLFRSMFAALRESDWSDHGDFWRRFSTQPVPANFVTLTARLCRPYYKERLRGL